MQETDASLLTCRNCGELKPIEDFDRRADSGGHHSLCKSCRRDYQRERWRRAHPPKQTVPRLIGTAPEFMCTRCREMRPASAFARRRRGEDALHWWCRDCFSELHAMQYVTYRERELQRVARNKAPRLREARRRITEHLRTHPCVDCGEADPLLLEFDHVRDKVSDVTTLAWRLAPWEEVQAEIEKCEVRCGNCHRRRTAERRRERKAQVPATSGSFDLASTSLLGKGRQIRLTFGVRTCAGCKLTKALSEFAPRSADGARVVSRCRPCRAAYQREWYQRNRQSAIRHARRNRDEAVRMLRQRVRFYLLQHPCTDCGEPDPDVLDFDHLKDKTTEVSRMVRGGWSWRSIMDEIAKCEVVCANCHKLRTYHRRQRRIGTGR